MNMEAVRLSIVLVFVVAWIALGTRLVITSQELLRTFCARYPLEAQLRIPHAFSHTRHPQKVLYFISNRARRFLEEKNDGTLLAKRLSMRRTLLGFLSLHFGGMLALIGLFLLLQG